VTFEKFSRKLAIIQADEYLSIDTTMDCKRKIVGSKRLWECSSNELNDILKEFKKEYNEKTSRKKSSYKSKYRYRKSKHKYSARKDWD